MHLKPTIEMLKKIRIKYNITQKEISYGIIDTTYLSHLESGRKKINQETLSLLIDKFNQISIKKNLDFELNKKILMLSQKEKADALFEKLIYKLENYPSKIETIEKTFEKFSRYFSDYQNSIFIHKLTLVFYDNQNWKKCHYYSKKFILYITFDEKYYFRLGQILLINSISILKNGNFEAINEIEDLISKNITEFNEETLEKLLLNVMNIFISQKIYKKNLFYNELYINNITTPTYLVDKEILFAITLKGLKQYDESLKIYKRLAKISNNINTQLLCNNNIIYLLKELDEKEKIKYRYNISKKLISHKNIDIKILKKTYYTLGYTAVYLKRKKDIKHFFHLFLTTETYDYLEEYSIDKQIKSIKYLLPLTNKNDLDDIIIIKNKILEINKIEPSTSLIAQFIEFLVKNNLTEIMAEFLMELQKQKEAD